MQSEAKEARHTEQNGQVRHVGAAPLSTGSRGGGASADAT
jgi:hypothetical protein